MNIRQFLYYRYDALILSHPWRVLLLLAGLLLCFAGYVPHFKLDASADSLLLEDDQDLKRSRAVANRYGSKEFMFVTFTPDNGDLFSDDSLAVIRSLRNAFVRLDVVDSVVSLVDVPLLMQQPGGLSDIVENMRTLDDQDVDRDRAREELLGSPIFRDLIISTDGHTTALQINVKDERRLARLSAEREMLREKRLTDGLSAEEAAYLSAVLQEYDEAKDAWSQRIGDAVQQIREIILPFQSQGQLYLGGMPMIVDDMITFIRRDLIVFGLGIFLFLIAMLGWLFRRPRWVILPLCSCLYAGIMMIGLLGLMAWKVTVISANFVSLMLIITMSMNIHLIVRYRQLREDFPERGQRELVLQTVAKMVWPCLYTTLTTIIAFSSLVFSGIKPVIYFGWMMSIGLGVAFLITFLLFPCLLLVLSSGTADPVSHRRGFHITGRLADLTAHHGGKVWGLSLLLLLVGVVGMRHLEVENSFVNYFSDRTEIHQGLKHIDRHLGGTTPLDVVLDLSAAPTMSSEEEDEFMDLFGAGEDETAWLTPQRVDTIRVVHEYLQALPAVGKVLSLDSVIRVGERIHQAQFDALELAILSRNIPEVLHKSIYAPYIDEAHDEARISIRVLDSLPSLRRNALIEKIRTDLVSVLGLSPDQFQISGLMILYNNMLQSLFRSQIQTLGVVMVGIFLMLLILFRSVVFALIGIIPNLLVAASILGLMGIFRIPLDLMTITIAAITIGIAVDNSIHYIYRFREEWPRFNDYTETMRHCHSNIGRAVFYTAITIIAGFSILSLSNFIPTIYFGLLTALSMALALLAALTLLPRLIFLLRPFS